MVVKVVALLSGMGTMALQMSAVRKLAPWVGASTMVWATIIGFSLLAMACGYALGGWLADRFTGRSVLSLALIGAAAFISVSPFVVDAVMPLTRFEFGDPSAAVTVASGIGYLSSFFLPAVLLGVTLPFLTRAELTALERAGLSAGRVYAISTVGSVLGTLLSALVMLQWLGVRWTLWSIAGALAITALFAKGIRVSRIESPVSPERTGVIAFRVAAVVICAEGFATMATEISAVRLIAPFFGSSQVVWAVVIAVTMGCIAAGAWLGGRYLDKSPTVTSFWKLLMCAGAAIAILPFLAVPLMRLSVGGLEDVNVALLASTFIASMVLLMIPMLLLGAIPPSVLRLSVPDVSRGGHSAGLLYALSTLGALFGTLIAALWMVPAFGAPRSLLLAASVLLLGSMVLASRWVVRAIPAVVISLMLLIPTGLVRPMDNEQVIHEAESDFQFVQVTEDEDGVRRLRLNEGWAVHSIYRRDTVLTNQYWDNFLLMPDMFGGTPESLLIIGNSAGTTARAFEHYFGDVRVDGVEIDAEVSAVGEKYFDAPMSSVVNADGRPFLANADRKWQLMQVDAYRQPYIPFYVTTREFFQVALERLTPGGVLVLNAGTTPENDSVSRAIAATMRSVFPLVLRYKAEDYNDILVGVNDSSITLDVMRQRLQKHVGPVPHLAQDFARNMEEVTPGSGRVLTDNKAPVEWMTNQMIFSEATR